MVGQILVEVLLPQINVELIPDAARIDIGSEKLYHKIGKERCEIRIEIRSPIWIVTRIPLHTRNKVVVPVGQGRINRYAAG